MMGNILKWKLLKLTFILKLWLVKKFYETAPLLLKKKRIFVFNLPNFILFSLFSYINFYHMARTQSNFLLTDIWKLQVNFTFHWWMVTEYTWEGGRRGGERRHMQRIAVHRIPAIFKKLEKFLHDKNAEKEQRNFPELNTSNPSLLIVY